MIEEGNLVVNGVANSGNTSPLGRSGTVTLGSSGTMDGGFFYEGAANDSTNRPITILRALLSVGTCVFRPRITNREQHSARQLNRSSSTAC